MSLLPLGIALQLGSCFLAALGYVLQKSAHVLRAAAGDHTPLYKSCRWLLGLFSMVVSACCAVGSAPLVPQSMQGPLGAVTIIFNSFLAAGVLHETLTVLDALSTSVIVAGTVLAVVTNESSTAQLKFSDVIALLRDDLVYAYTVIALCILGGLGYFVERTSHQPWERWTHTQRRIFAMAAPAIGGLSMGYTGYGSKVIATAILNADSAAFVSPYFYIYIVGTVLAVCFQVRWLNAGLEFFSALAIVPVFQAAIIFSNALDGIVYFHDMRDSAPWRLGLFGIGAATCMAGVGLLLLKRQPPPVVSPRAGDAAPTADGKPSGTSLLLPDGLQDASESRDTASSATPTLASLHALRTAHALRKERVALASGVSASDADVTGTLAESPTALPSTDIPIAPPPPGRFIDQPFSSAVADMWRYISGRGRRLPGVTMRPSTASNPLHVAASRASPQPPPEAATAWA